MAKSKVSRKELLSTNDEFINFSSRAFIFISEHTRQFQIAGYCLIAIVLIYIGFYFYLGNINNKAQNVYNTAYMSLYENMKPDISKEDLDISRENFSRVIDDYSISKISRLAIPQLAYIDYLEKDYDSAIAKYQDYLDKSPEEPYRSYTLLALSACYEDKGQYDKALSNLEIIIAGSDDILKEQAMLNLARIYRLENNFDKSDKILNDFIEKYPSSSSLALAKSLLKKTSGNLTD